MKNKSIIELEKFIKANWQHLTVADISEETGFGEQRVWKQANRMGIKPISPKDQNIKYIQEIHKNMTYEQVRKKLGLKESYMRKICTEAGISCSSGFKQLTSNIPEPEPTKEDKISVRQILAGYQRDVSIHYNHDEESPYFLDKIKNS